MQRSLSALLLGLALSGAGPTPPEVMIEVMIDNFSFAPAEIIVAAGTTVTWSNRDDIPHTITDAAEPRAFKSPPLDTGDKFSWMFKSPGTYQYFCSLHPHMQGRVVVR